MRMPRGTDTAKEMANPMAAIWKVSQNASQNSGWPRRVHRAEIASVAVAKESPASGPTDPMICHTISATIAEITPAGMRRSAAGTATPLLLDYRYCESSRPAMSAGCLRNPSASIFDAGFFRSFATI